MTYYQNSTDYHDDLDRFEARARAEEAERGYNILTEVENIYGKGWEQDANDLAYVLEFGNEMIENEEINKDWLDMKAQENELRNG